MVSLRRRRLLGLSCGPNGYVTPLPFLTVEEMITGVRNPDAEVYKRFGPIEPVRQQPKEETSRVEEETSPIKEESSPIKEECLPIKIVSLRIKDESSLIKDESSPIKKESPPPSQGTPSKPEPISPSDSGSFSPKALQHLSMFSVSDQPIKRRKRHRRKQVRNQEPCVRRGVYFKNRKWQAAIKVDKKQIHLGTFSSQEEAARLYDRAAFMCGREPNFELAEEEKRELQTLSWEEFLACTRQTITNKKPKRMLDLSAMKTSGTAVASGEFLNNKSNINSVSCSDSVEKGLVFSNQVLNHS